MQSIEYSLEEDANAIQDGSPSGAMSIKTSSMESAALIIDTATIDDRSTSHPTYSAAVGVVTVIGFGLTYAIPSSLVKKGSIGIAEGKFS